MKHLNPFSTEPLRDDDLLAVSNDGCPTAPDGRAVPPWLRAEKKWRVVPLARGKAPLFPPLSGHPAEEFVEEDHLVGSGFRPPMVVLGPAGAGLTTFQRWIRLRTHQAGIQLVELDFARIAQTDDPAEQREVLASSWFRSVTDSEIPSVDFAGMLDLLLLPGEPHAPSNNQLRTHILLRVDRLHRENNKILLGRLRDAVDRRALEGARFAVLAHETAPLEDGEPFSSFLDVCEVYRLADFTVADVAAMWRHWVPERASQADQVAQKCIEWTGGQPILVNLYLGRLFDDVGNVEKEIISKSFDRVKDWLLEHPPRNALQHWQGELARIVAESSLLRRNFGRFLAGEVRENVIREELPLFLAGWIGQDAAGRWAIRSKAHAQWAADPLRAPENYYREVGGGR